MIISFNSHYPHKEVDHHWPANLPFEPQLCFETIFGWLANLNLDPNTTHTLVMPGVREGIVLLAYHALMGHFPNVLYSRREDDQWIWDSFPMQKVREEWRSKRR